MSYARAEISTGGGVSENGNKGGGDKRKRKCKGRGPIQAESGGGGDRLADLRI